MLEYRKVICRDDRGTFQLQHPKTAWVGPHAFCLEGDEGTLTIEDDGETLVIEMKRKPAELNT